MFRAEKEFLEHNVRESKVKFDEDGMVKPYYGNTVISFINQEENPVFQELKRVQGVLKQSSFAHCIAFLPESSLHMTNMPHCRHRDRNTDMWPSYLNMDAKFTEIDVIIKAKAEQVKAPEKYFMEVDYCAMNQIILKPCNEEMNREMRAYRDALADAVGIRHKDHDTYKFHIGLGYICQMPTAEQQMEAEVLCEKLTAEMKETLGVFEVQKADFVIFNDMFAYETDISKRGPLY